MITKLVLEILPYDFLLMVLLGGLFSMPEYAYNMGACRKTCVVSVLRSFGRDLQEMKTSILVLGS